MNNDDVWTERANSVVRHIVTLLFAGAIVWGFLILNIVSTDAFMGIAGMVIAWWFRSRDEDKQQKAIAATVEAVRTNGGKNSTGTPGA